MAMTTVLWMTGALIVASLVGQWAHGKRMYWLGVRHGRERAAGDVPVEWDHGRGTGPAVRVDDQGEL